MDFASFDKRVTLQAMSTTFDERHQARRTPLDLAEVWASVEPLSGREYFLARQVNAEATVRVRIRYRAGITPRMRVKYGSRSLEIVSVIDPGERHEELHLMCKELV